MADLDVITPDEAKAALNITTATFDDEIAGYITAVSQRLDDVCGPIVQRTVTDETHPGGTVVVWPRYTPIITVTTVTEYQSGTPTVLTAETPTVAGDYLLRSDSHNVQIRRRTSWSDSRFASSGVIVTYEAGRFASTELVSAKFKQAAAIFLTHLWRREQGARAGAMFGTENATQAAAAIPTFGLPNVVRDLVVAEMLPPPVA